MTFEILFHRKTIPIEIIDRDQYQRNESFLVRLGEPTLVKEETDAEELRMCIERFSFPYVHNCYYYHLAMTEEEKLIAELGKPKLGERHTLRIRIRESKEFKVNNICLPI